MLRSLGWSSLFRLLLLLVVCGCVKDFREPECNLDAPTMTVRVQCFGSVPIPACCVDGTVEGTRPFCSEEGAPAMCTEGQPICISGGEIGQDC